MDFGGGTLMQETVIEVAAWGDGRLSDTADFDMHVQSWTMLEIRQFHIRQ